MYIYVFLANAVSLICRPMFKPSFLLHACQPFALSSIISWVQKVIHHRISYIENTVESIYNQVNIIQ